MFEEEILKISKAVPTALQTSRMHSRVTSARFRIGLEPRLHVSIDVLGSRLRSNSLKEAKASRDATSSKSSTRFPSRSTIWTACGSRSEAKKNPTSCANKGLRSLMSLKET